MPRLMPTLAELKDLCARCDHEPRLWRILNRLIWDHSGDNDFIYVSKCSLLGLTPAVIEQQITEYWLSEAGVILGELNRGNYERVGELDAIIAHCRRAAKVLSITSDGLDAIHGQAESRRWNRDQATTWAA